MAVAECVRLPLFPVAVIVNIPVAEDVKERVDVAVPPDERVTLVGLRETVGPAGEEEPDSAMVPLKLFRLDNDTVEVTVDPVFVVKDVGLRERLKSGLLVDPTVTVPEAPPEAPFESVTFRVTG